MSIHDIAQTETATRYGKNGSLITMRNGEQWLHPFDGSKPIQICAADSDFERGYSHGQTIGQVFDPPYQSSERKERYRAGYDAGRAKRFGE